jgi:hypothetical protein
MVLLGRCESRTTTGATVRVDPERLPAGVDAVPAD